jgi:hypothetical protein
MLLSPCCVVVLSSLLHLLILLGKFSLFIFTSRELACVFFSLAPSLQFPNSYNIFVQWENKDIVGSGTTYAPQDPAILPDVLT